MKYLAYGLCLISFACQAAINIGSVENGSGAPGNAGVENATEVTNGIMHAPQYMPGYPTAATIWPRVITVPCEQNQSGDLDCKGYHWTPDMGRGEYLFFVPVAKPKEPEVVITPVIERHVEMTPLPRTSVLDKVPKPKKKKKFICKK